MILDTTLNFQEHLKNVLNKVNKTTGPLQKLQNVWLRGPPLTIYKSFIRPHLDCGDIINVNTIIVLFTKNWSRYKIMLL